MLGPSRILVARRLASSTTTTTMRTFHASTRRLAEATPLPAKKPMGAFRGGLFGFLLGCVVSGGSVYSYLLTEYKASNDMLTEDIYTLQASVTRLSNYVQNLEQRTKGK